MEMLIYSPKPEERIPEITWNFEEVRKFAMERAKYYQSMAYTSADVQDMKKDRADINKFINALEDARKNKKKEYMAPYEVFEKQVKETLAPLRETVNLIGEKLDEVDQVRREEKKKEIQLLFDAVGFQPFVKLDMIFDEKWLNASVSLKKVDEALHEALYRIGEDVYTISQLPEFSFEAMETYKKTLNLTNAIQEGQRLADIQKRKMEHEEELRRQAAEAEQRHQAEEAARNDAEQHQETPEEVTGAPVSPAETVERPSEETVYTIDFRVTGTRDQLAKLKEFLSANRIQYAPVPKEGE